MFLQTDRIGFRQLEKDDLPKLRDWRNSTDVRCRTREYKPLNLLNQEKWFESLGVEDIMFGIFTNELGEYHPLIGVAGATNISWKNKSAELSWYIGNEEYKRKRLSRHIIFLLSCYVFDELGLYRFWGEAYILDEWIIDLYRKLGFTIDGVIRNTYWWDGKWWPSLYFSMTIDEWNAIKENYLK